MRIWARSCRPKSAFGSLGVGGGGTRGAGLGAWGASAGGGEVGGVGPGKVADALLVAGEGVELLAELEVVAVGEDRAEHGVAGRSEGGGRVEGSGRCGDADLGEERGGERVSRDRSG